ncbi:SRPBCC domain-containing protein [Antrihabitans cavernicola]|uniref:SRPBCC domain-containing protein n=1 Tax=Antrihabitans cavernicola TaxID=2495913 RepID=A0A5A7S5N9_9NOCA|nr:SRPBCC domain-containing protein [Spelaeibacter cavernicola]KAA0018385.1 SRPBCC domain-containing protein [Spelaeibacter cavernicola]
MPVGKTRDAGWEIGVSKTLPYPIDAVWNILVARPSVWLGPDVSVPTEKGEQWQSSDGAVGELRSRRDRDRIRLTWKPSGWDHDTTVQVAVGRGPNGTLVRFHQERLADAAERELQREHWQSVMDALESALAATT